MLDAPERNESDFRVWVERGAAAAPDVPRGTVRPDGTDPPRRRPQAALLEAARSSSVMVFFAVSLIDGDFVSHRVVCGRCGSAFWHEKSRRPVLALLISFVLGFPRQ